MAVLNGIKGSTGPEACYVMGVEGGSSSSGKTNTSTNTGTSSNTTTKTNNTSSSQNTSGGTGAANAGTSASNSATSGGNTTNVTVNSTVTNKTSSSQEAAQRAAAEAAQKAAAEAAQRAAAEAAQRAAAEAAQKAAAEAAQRAAAEAAQRAAAEAAQKAAAEAAQRAAAEAAQRAAAEAAQRAAAEAAQRAAAEAAQRAAAEAAQRAAAEAAQKAAAEAAQKAAEEAFRKSEAEEAQRRATKAAIAEAARKAAEEEEQEKDKSFIDVVIDIYEKSKKYNEDIKKVEQQVLVEQVEMVGTTMNQLWDNYMLSMEQNQKTTQATAEGINQWNKIIAGDASDLTEEERENLHMALDVMSMLPGGGVYDWLNAELYAAEGNTEMAAASTLAVAVPGALPLGKKVVDKAVDIYNMSKGVDLMNLALKAGSIDELAEGMIKYGDEMQEAGEILAKQAVEGGTDIIKLSGNNIQHIKKHTFEGMAEQAKYLTDKQLANKLANTTFFNKNWSQDEVVKYTQEAYNALRKQGKTGLHSVEIKGEVINIFIKEDGAFDTAYGVYHYTVEDFR